MKRYMNHTATIGMLAILIGVGAGAPEATAGTGNCMACQNCPGDLTVCFPGETPSSACTDLGCSFWDTSYDCSQVTGEGCPSTEAGQCDDGVNNVTTR